MNDREDCLIVAAYLSIYDLKGVKALGYSARSKAFEDLGAKLGGYKESYLRNLMNEFDPLTGSQRKGWHGRPPRQRIEDVLRKYQQLSFEDYTNLIKRIIFVDDSNIIEIKKETTKETEYLLEQILSSNNDNAGYKVSVGIKKARVLNKKTIDKLKKLYENTCQFCGGSFGEEYGCSILEGHHIDYFSETENSQPSNILIICPNCHSLIHKTNPNFNFVEKVFYFENGKKVTLKLNKHLL